MLQMQKNANDNTTLQTSYPLAEQFGRVSFDSHDPIGSITNFCNGRNYLNASEQAAFVLDVGRFLTDKAYRDERLELTDALKERFAKVFIPGFLGATTLPLTEKQRMVAVAEKVTGIHFTALSDKYQVNQFKTQDISKEVPHEWQLIGNEGWGWIGRDLVMSSELKKDADFRTGSHAFRKNDAGYTTLAILDFENLSPTARRALEPLLLWVAEPDPTSRNHTLNLNNIEPIVELLNFTTKWKLDRLTEQLVKLLKDTSREEYTLFSKYAYQYLCYAPFIEALKRIGHKLLIEGNNFTKEQIAKIDQINANLSSPYYRNQDSASNLNSLDTDHAASRFFDTEKPFESIARFTDRFSVLDPHEQRKFVSTVSEFFRSKASQNETIAIPKNYAKRFALVDLKFLTSFIPSHTSGSNCKDFERHRFIASVQQCTRKRFLALEPHHQLYQLLLKQGASSPSVYSALIGLFRRQFVTDTPDVTPLGWLKKGFVDDSKLKKTEPAAAQTSQGYAENDDLTVDDLSPLLALVLQRFQYPPAELSELESAGSLQSVITLQVWAEKWEMKPLSDAIVKWLKGQKSEDYENAAISLLHQDEIYNFYMKKNVFFTLPKGSTVDEATSSIVHKFNIETIFKYASNAGELVQGLNEYVGSDPSKLKALHQHKKTAQKAEVSTVVDQNTMGIFTNQVKSLKNQKAGRFIQAAVLREGVLVQDNAFEEAPFTAQTKRLVKEHQLAKDDFDAAAVFLASQEVRDFFNAIDASKTRSELESLLSDIRATLFIMDKLATDRPKVVQHADLTSTITFPEDFDDRIRRLVEFVNQQNLDKQSKVTTFLHAFAHRQYSVLGIFLTQLIDFQFKNTGHQNLKDLIDLYEFADPISRKEAIVLSAILSRADVQAFFDENNFSGAPLVKKTLDFIMCESDIVAYAKQFDNLDYYHFDQTLVDSARRVLDQSNPYQFSEHADENALIKTQEEFLKALQSSHDAQQSLDTSILKRVLAGRKRYDLEMKYARGVLMLETTTNQKERETLGLFFLEKMHFLFYSTPWKYGRKEQHDLDKIEISQAQAAQICDFLEKGSHLSANPSPDFRAATKYLGDALKKFKESH